MPIVIDRNPARLAAFAAMGAGAQARRMDDAHLVSQALRDAAILREGDQRQQQIDQSQQAQQFHQQDIQGLRQLQEQQRQQASAAIGAPPAAPGGAAGTISPANANGGTRPPGAASSGAMPDLSRLEPEMQMRVVEYLRQQAQDQQDVQNAQFAVEQATKRGVFGDFDTMDGLSRASTMANLAKSGPAGARQVMAVIARREQEMEAERKAREQQDRLDERAMETQRHEDYRAELGQFGQTQRAAAAQAAKVDPVAQRQAQFDSVFASQQAQYPRGNPDVLRGRVQQWVATGKMEDAPTLSVSGVEKQTSPLKSPEYLALKERASMLEGKIATLSKAYKPTESAEAELEKVYAKMAEIQDKVAGGSDATSSPESSIPPELEGEINALADKIVEQIMKGGGKR